jgi:hypothetical protein
MAWRVAALLSSRREGGGGSAVSLRGGMAGAFWVGGTALHYVHFYTLCKFLRMSDSQLPNSFMTGLP